MDPECGLKFGYNTTLVDYNVQFPYSTLCTYGGRSFSILDAGTGSMVYDSGDEIEVCGGWGGAP